MAFARKAKHHKTHIKHGKLPSPAEETPHEQKAILKWCSVHTFI